MTKTLKKGTEINTNKTLLFEKNNGIIKKKYFYQTTIEVRGNRIMCGSWYCGMIERNTYKCCGTLINVSDVLNISLCYKCLKINIYKCATLLSVAHL